MTHVQQLLAQLDLVGFHPFRAITVNGEHWKAIQREHAAANHGAANHAAPTVPDVAMIGGVPVMPLAQQRTAWLLFTNPNDLARHIDACGETDKWLEISAPYAPHECTHN